MAQNFRRFTSNNVGTGATTVLTANSLAKGCRYLIGGSPRRCREKQNTRRRVFTLKRKWINEGKERERSRKRH